MLNLVRLVAGATFAILLATLIYAQQQQSMWEAGHLFREVWFNATLMDFYTNIAMLSLWAIYKENSVLAKLAWPIAFALLGGLGVTAYVLLASFRIPPGAPWWAMLLRREHAARLSAAV